MRRRGELKGTQSRSDLCSSLVSYRRVLRKKATTYRGARKEHESTVERHTPVDLFPLFCELRVVRWLRSMATLVLKGVVLSLTIWTFDHGSERSLSGRFSRCALPHGRCALRAQVPRKRAPVRRDYCIAHARRDGHHEEVVSFVTHPQPAILCPFRYAFVKQDTSWGYLVRSWGREREVQRIV